MTFCKYKSVSTSGILTRYTDSESQYYCTKRQRPVSNRDCNRCGLRPKPIACDTRTIAGNITSSTICSSDTFYDDDSVLTKTGDNSPFTNFMEKKGKVRKRTYMDKQHKINQTNKRRKKNKEAKKARKKK